MTASARRCFSTAAGHHGLGVGLDSPQHVDLASLIGWG